MEQEGLFVHFSGFKSTFSQDRWVWLLQSPSVGTPLVALGAHLS